MDVIDLIHKMESNFRAFYQLLHPLAEGNAEVPPNADAAHLEEILNLTTCIEDEVIDFRLKKIQNEEHPYLPAINVDRIKGGNSNMLTSLPESITIFLNHKKGLIKYLYSVPATEWERTGVHQVEGHLTFNELVRRMIDKDSWLQQELKAALKHSSE